MSKTIDATDDKIKVVESIDELLSYNETTGEISITYNGETITHTAKEWHTADTGNILLRRDLDLHFRN